MAAYDNKVLNGEHLSYLVGLIKAADATKQDAISASNKLDPAFIDTDNDAAFVTASEKSTWSAKQDALAFNTAYDATTNKVATMSDIPSVSAFQTASDVQAAITTALSGVSTFHFEVVSALPQSNIDTNVIYLLPKTVGGTNNIYEEWAYVKVDTDSQTGDDVFGWESFGDTQVEITALSNTEIQTIWNGASAS